MPQIVSLLPAAAATPAATPVPATVAAAPDVLMPVDPTAPNFLAQFKSALKSLAQAVVLPQVALHPTPDQATGPLLAPILDTSGESPVKAADDATPTDLAVPQLLAELGFVTVPPAFVMPPTPNAAPVPTQPAPATTRVPRAIAPQLATAPLLSAPSAPPHQPAPGLGPIAGQETHAQVPMKVQAAPLAQLGPVAPSALPQASPQTAPVLPVESNQPLAHLKPADLAQVPAPAPTVTTAPAAAVPQTVAAASVVLQPAPATNQPAAAAPAQPAPGSVTPIVGPQLPAQGGSQSSNTDRKSDHGPRTAHKLAPIAAESTPVQSAPVADGAMAAAAATTAPISGGPLPVQVGPGEVVSQIARHADLIRLPGNRGLKIQLHPEDLGGVQVTVRYSASGGVELHISAEHTATGALVQAGWGELRDALATQGISADRLMLSVTGPTGAGQADLTGGGGNRADQHSTDSNSSQSSQAGLNSENGQSQARQDAPPQRGSQGGWSGPLDPISAPDGNLRVASATAAPSHIDYRV